MSTAARSDTPPRFHSAFTEALPGDPVRENARRQVPGACFSRVEPTPVRAPRTLAFSPEVAARLGFSEAYCRSDEFAEVMAGNRLLPGMDPHAMCYGGHQFGNWAGQLGDGRAIVLGEVESADGGHETLQLKGAGPTPYSRTADGRAVLRSSLREYLCSEAMAHLGVPTTRALSLVTTGEDVVRDMFYDGRPAAEPGAVVCRVAPSFVRFGNFELHAARGEHELLRTLLEFVIERDFPHLAPSAGPETWVRWFGEVADRTADLMVHWMRVGFVHGVMNTDNLSVLGQTIDYGPYGWLESYDPDWTPNTTDAHGRRYRYGAQPQIGMWNLTQLGNALYPLVGETEPLQQVLEGYAERFQRGWFAMMNDRLGLDGHDAGRDDNALYAEALGVLGAIETDFTIFFRRLSQVPVGDADARSDAELIEPLADAWYDASAADTAYRERLAAFLRRWAARGADTGVDVARMDATNPKYVLRNWMAQLAIDAATAGDAAVLEDLHAVLRRPYDEQPEAERWFARRPEWARERAGCSMLSCSS